MLPWREALLLSCTRTAALRYSCVTRAFMAGGNSTAAHGSSRAIVGDDRSSLPDAARFDWRTAWGLDRDCARPSFDASVLTNQHTPGNTENGCPSGSALPLERTVAPKDCNEPWWRLSESLGFSVEEVRRVLRFIRRDFLTRHNSPRNSGHPRYVAWSSADARYGRIRGPFVARRI